MRNVLKARAGHDDAKKLTIKRVRGGVRVRSSVTAGSEVQHYGITLVNAIVSH
jgi:hypothetical protein